MINDELLALERKIAKLILNNEHSMYSEECRFLHETQLKIREVRVNYDRLVHKKYEDEISDR